MSSPYVTKLMNDLEESLEKCKNFKLTLEDFLHDYPFIEGMNKNFPPFLVKTAIERAEIMERTIKEFMDLLKENLSENE